MRRAASNPYHMSFFVSNFKDFKLVGGIIQKATSGQGLCIDLAKAQL